MQALEVKSMCDELLKAKMAGKITQDQLDYELAKLSFEMLGDYSPKRDPHMTGELARFQTMSRSEWAALSPEVFKAEETRFAELKAKHKAAVSHVRAENNSNLHWLKNCLESFKKNNNPKWMYFQNMIADHQGIPV